MSLLLALLAPSFTFAVYGDSRADHRAHGALVAQMVAARPDFVIHTGDFVTRGEPAEWARFAEVVAPLRAISALVPVVGNHDLLGDDGAGLRRAFPRLERRAYYVVRHRNVAVVVLDAEGEQPDAAQIRWAERMIAAEQATPGVDHVIAAVHRGPFSTHPDRDGHPRVRAALPRLQAAGLDLIVSGHDHYYERGRSAGGLPYLVLGGGGAPLYPTTGPRRGDGFVAEFSRTVHSFVRLRVSGGVLRGCAVDLSGAPFDCFSLDR